MKGDKPYTHKRFRMDKVGVIATKTYESGEDMKADNPGLCVVHGPDDAVSIVFRTTQRVEVAEVTNDDAEEVKQTPNMEIELGDVPITGRKGRFWAC